MSFLFDGQFLKFVYYTKAVELMSKNNDKQEENEYNSRIENVASLIVKDQISLDEQDPQKLKKYYQYVKTNFKMEGEAAKEFVNEAFLYLKLRNAQDVDPIKEGDQFGAGFS